MAALSLPSLLNRCQASMIRYVADEALRANLPFPRYAYLLAAMLVYMLCSRQKNCRAREDELLYILRKLSELKLWPGTLWAATSNAPSTHSLQQPREYLCSIMLTAAFLRNTYVSIQPSIPPCRHPISSLTQLSVRLWHICSTFIMYSVILPQYLVRHRRPG